MLRRTHLDDIDGLRAVAVLSVLAYHVALGAPGIGPKPFWIANGARGVRSLLCRLGILLGLSHPIGGQGGRRGPTLDYGKFLSQRIVRIAPPYLVALTMFAALSLTRFGMPTSHSVHFSLGSGLRAYVLDALFLTSYTPAFNGSFWTIGLEMRWYVLFPIVMFAYLRYRPAAFVLIGLCYATTLSGAIDIETIRTLPCFFLGIVAADLRLQKHAFCRFALPLFVIVAPIAFWRQAYSGDIDHGEPLWQLASFLLVLASGSGVIGSLVRWRPLRAIGVASFSIYLMHQPIALSLESSGVAPLASAVGALLCGLLFFTSIESRFLNVRFRKPAEAAVNTVLTLLVKKPILLPVARPRIEARRVA